MSQTSETQFWVRPAAGGEFGPASMAVVKQWAREGRIGRDAMIVAADGSPPVIASSHPEFAPIVNAPPTVGGTLQMPRPTDDGGISVLIPYKNGAALAGYYVSVGSLIPIVGLVLGPIAIILGVLGLRAAGREPRVKGVAHAWVAIVLGTLVLLGHAAVIVLIVARV